jgi:hypothetical protein
MQYKTIVLELLQQHPEMYDQLLENRTLLPTLERFGSQLRDSHLDWKERLTQARPSSNESQIASEAMEMALKDLADSLPPASTPDNNGPLSLDAAMTFIRGHTQPA